MRPGQVWVFLEIGLGVVFIITMFCLCRYFDARKSRRKKTKAKAADEECYQRQLSAQRERAMSIRRESLLGNEFGSAEVKEPLTAVQENPEEQLAGDNNEEGEKAKSSATADDAAPEEAAAATAATA